MEESCARVLVAETSMEKESSARILMAQRSMVKESCARVLVAKSSMEKESSARVLVDKSSMEKESCVRVHEGEKSKMVWNLEFFGSIKCFKEESEWMNISMKKAKKTKTKEEKKLGQ